jgi:hypothetical protein
VLKRSRAVTDHDAYWTRVRRRWPIAAAVLIAAGFVALFVRIRSAQRACKTPRVASLAVLAAEVAAGNSVCLANGSYRGSVELANTSRRRVVVTQEGRAVIYGQVRLRSSHLALDGLVVRTAAGGGPLAADCTRIEAVGGTDIQILNSDLGPCARDAIRMAFNRGRHDTGVIIGGNTLHDIGGNGCTCYMRGGRFADNIVERIGNDALDLWGDSNLVSHNVFQDLAPRGDNHNDVLETWQNPRDPATGDPLTNLVFERNIIDTVKGPNSHGLLIKGGGENRRLTIRSNLLRDIGSIGILLAGARDVSLFANTFARAGRLDTVEWKHGATGSMDSNIFYGAAGVDAEPWFSDRASHPLHRYNLAWAGKPLVGEPTGLNADPKFYDPSGRRDNDRGNDFRILDSTSAAIDHGDPSTAQRIDIRGAPIHGRGVDDGAFEYTGNEPSQPANR